MTRRGHFLPVFSADNLRVCLKKEKLAQHSSTPSSTRQAAFTTYPYIKVCAYTGMLSSASSSILAGYEKEGRGVTGPGADRTNTTAFCAVVRNPGDRCRDEKTKLASLTRKEKLRAARQGGEYHGRQPTTATTTTTYLMRDITRTREGEVYVF